MDAGLMEAKTIADIKNAQEETNKFSIEQHKLAQEALYMNKRNQYFTATFVLGVFAAGIAFAKLFI